jgi:membrane AbrB-like protein
MKKADVIQMKTILLPAVLLLLGMIILNLSLGYGIHRITGLELSTSLFGSAPGGVQDMALIAEDLGANASQVALLQLTRLLSALGIMPLLLRAFINRYKRNRPITPHVPETVVASTVEKKDEGKGLKSFTFTIFFAAIGGLLLNLTNIPAGSMIGAMLATVIASLTIKPAYVPPKFPRVLQTCVGALIGSGIGMSELAAMADILVPAVMLVTVLLIANFVFGFIMYKATKLDLVTALLSTSAGGLTEMALIAGEMGADAPKVAVLHLVRLISVIAFFPTIITRFVT